MIKVEAKISIQIKKKKSNFLFVAWRNSCWWIGFSVFTTRATLPAWGSLTRETHSGWRFRRVQPSPDWERHACTDAGRWDAGGRRFWFYTSGWLKVKGPDPEFTLVKDRCWKQWKYLKYWKWQINYIKYKNSFLICAVKLKKINFI